MRSRALEAIDALLAALRDDPDLLFLKGHLLDRLGEYEAARRMYGRVLRHKGANVLAAMDMGGIRITMPAGWISPSSGTAAPSPC